MIGKSTALNPNAEEFVLRPLDLLVIIPVRAQMQLWLSQGHLKYLAQTSQNPFYKITLMKKHVSIGITTDFKILGQDESPRKSIKPTT